MNFAPGQSYDTELRPRYEGCNICTWIGFKHVNYLVEEAVLALFRSIGYGPGYLYEKHGLGLDIVRISTRILKALHIDDVVEATATISDLSSSAEIRVTLTVRGVKAATSKVAVQLIRDSRLQGKTLAVPAELLSITVDSCRTSELAEVDLEQSLLSKIGRDEVSKVPLSMLKTGGRSIAWRWRVPYFYCHFVTRLQMSGLLRNMEEVVDLFLREGGASIRTMLDSDDLIPVVPSSEIELYDEVGMEEEILTVFEVESVFKKSIYTARVDTYALRDGTAVLVSSGRITHGYAHIDSRRDWSMVEFNRVLMAALT